MWCYTTNPDHRWEYCKIDYCKNNGGTLNGVKKVKDWIVFANRENKWNQFISRKSDSEQQLRQTFYLIQFVFIPYSKTFDKYTKWCQLFINFQRILTKLY